MNSKKKKKRAREFKMMIRNDGGRGSLPLGWRALRVCVCSVEPPREWAVAMSLRHLVEGAEDDDKESVRISLMLSPATVRQETDKKIERIGAVAIRGADGAREE